MAISTNQMYIWLWLLYVACMLAVTYYTYKKVEGIVDFYVASRSLGPWIIAFTWTATFYSSGIFVSTPAFVYQQGWAYASVALFITCWMAFMGSYLVIAPRLRMMTEKTGALTFQEFFGLQLAPDNPDARRTLQFVSSIIYVFAAVIYVAAILMGAAIVPQSLFGWSYGFSLAMVSGLTVLYMVAGGFYAVAWTDFFQGLFMLACLAVMLPMTYNAAGGITNLMANLKAIDPKLVYGGVQPWSMTLTTAMIFGIGTLGQPHMANRFMAIKYKRDLGVAFIVTLFIASFIQISTYFGAVAARGMFGNQFMTKADQMMPNLVQKVFAGFPLGIGLFLVGIVAASMSTLDSVALSLACTIQRDLMEGVLRRKVSEQRSIFLTRVWTIVVCVIGVLFAIKPPQMIFSFISLTFGMCGAAFTVPLIATLWWKKTTWQGCATGMAMGFIVMLIWQFAKLGILNPFFPGVIASWISLVIVSLATQKPVVASVPRALGD